MSTIKELRAACVPLAIDHIDTDQIIPARFLKATTRDGFGENLFRDWRFLRGDVANPDFVLNQARYKGAEVLVVGKNFGCGSSREHAAWAIADYGFRVVIAPSFADIFKSNALNNGILVIEAPEALVSELMAAVEENPATEILVDLPAQTVRAEQIGLEHHFAINPYKKECLMNGYDDIDYIFSLQPFIEEYESGRFEFLKL